MCGVAAVIGAPGEPARLEEAKRMAAAQAHRGPDAEGSMAEGRVAFGFRRLSILDLSPAGHQPLWSLDERLAIIFNGEIYNYVELREELRALGHQFRSSGDTEVLLAAFAQWGIGCLPRLNGMWAFLVYDRSTGVVTGSRDRLGLKPLYHAREAGRHYFASEIKALHAVLPRARTVDHGRMAALLAAGALEALPEGRGTFYRSVEQVEPGTWFTIAPDGTLRSGRYWDLPPESGDGPADLPAAFRDLFLDAISLRLRSDVPVGVALSGGIDSTAIIGAMARLREETPGSSGPLHAFSYLPPEFGERGYVEATVARTGACLHEVTTSPEAFWEGLPGLLRAHDEPIHSMSAWVGHEVYGAARRAGVVVVLGGQGADECWGGYPSYFTDWWQTLIRRGRLGQALGEIREFAQGHGRGASGLAVREALRSVLHTAARVPLYRQLMARRQVAARYPFRALLGPALQEALPAEWESPPPGDLSAVLRWGASRTPLPLYLRIEDRNSMAQSVEARLPFMDYRLVEMAFRLGAEWKLRGQWNKVLVREGTEGLMPESVRTRVDKMGFPTTLAHWFRGPLRGPLEARLRDPALAATGLVDSRAAQAVLAQHLGGVADHSRALLNVVQLPLWLEQT